MMFPNHLFIRLREVRILALFVCCILISSCSKEASISIPDHLTGSEWAMYTEETDYTLRFMCHLHKIQMRTACHPIQAA